MGRLKMQEAQNNYSGWTLVELFGHQQEAGFVTTEYFGTAAMFRIDIPGLEEREYELEKPEYGAHTSYRELPIGTKVKRSAISPRSRLVGVSAIYGMTPCTEEVVKTAIERSIGRPLIVLSLPDKIQLAECGTVSDSEYDDYDPEEDMA